MASFFIQRLDVWAGSGSATKTNTTTVLRDTASAYKVDIEAITAKVKQEFAVKEKRQVAKKTKAA